MNEDSKEDQELTEDEAINEAINIVELLSNCDVVFPMDEGEQEWGCILCAKTAPSEDSLMHEDECPWLRSHLLISAMNGGAQH